MFQYYYFLFFLYVCVKKYDQFNGEFAVLTECIYVGFPFIKLIGGLFHRTQV